MVQKSCSLLSLRILCSFYTSLTMKYSYEQKGRIVRAVPMPVYYFLLKTSGWSTRHRVDYEKLLILSTSPHLISPSTSPQPSEGAITVGFPQLAVCEWPRRYWCVFARILRARRGKRGHSRIVCCPRTLRTSQSILRVATAVVTKMLNVDASGAWGAVELVLNWLTNCQLQD